MLKKRAVTGLVVYRPECGGALTISYLHHITIVLNPAEPLVIRPITAYDVPEPTE
jgi:hypothetical protein